MDNMVLDISALHQRYQEGLRPAEVIDLVYRRIAEANDPGIFLSMFPKQDVIAMAEALGAFDSAKPLWGIPFAVKDNIDVAGLSTTAGCPAFAYEPKEHAFGVQCLIDAGAIPIGKTNLDQFATGLVGVRTPGVAPKNAFDPAIVPGGSSSGSAVAVARDLVSFALGTDTAGSGRVPAALNNIVGLKPSLGAISSRGVVPACKSLDCVSIFAGSVADAWRVFDVVTRPDPTDAFQRPIAADAPGASPPRWTCGVPRAEDLEFFGDEAAAEAWRAASAILPSLGATLVEIDMTPFLETARLLYDGPWVAERHAALRRFLATNADDVLPVTRGIIAVADKFSATDAFEATYKLRELELKTRKAMRLVDMLAVPSLPTPPTVGDVARDPLGPNSRLGRWTNFVNLLDLCALAVPGPFRRDGFPAGVTFIGPRAADGRLASVGSAFHAKSTAGVRLGRMPPAALIAKAAPQDQIEIVVVGAHLSGMALNHELTRLGGQLSRAVKTQPSYKFFALAGGPPKRPGLLRCAADTGSAIETEVWLLPPEGFARFVSGIPAPLGIGTILLADGTRPKGFLVEPEGLDGARDISAFGGWRNFMVEAAL